MEFALATLSSKGQLVIPSEMRGGLKAGDRLLVIKDGQQLILKRARALDKQLAEDVEYSRRIAAAWKRYDKGEFKKSTAEEFLKDLDTW